MGLLDLFKRRDPRNNHDWTAEDRVAAAEARRLNRELKIEEQKLRIREMQADFEIQKKEKELELARIEAELSDLRGEDESGDMTDQLITQLATAFMPQIISKFQTPKAGESVQPSSGAITPSADVQSSPALRELSNEELKKMWDNSPAMAKSYARHADDDTVLMQIKKILPNCTEDTYIRAFKIIRGLEE